MRFALPITAALIAAPAAHAEGFTADTLYEVCHDRTSENWVRQNQWVCASYIRGVVDGIRVQVYQALPEGEREPAYLPFCFPPGSVMENVIDLVVRYIEAKPSIRPQSGSLAVREALTTNWPCLR